MEFIPQVAASYPSVQQEVARLAGSPEVRAAFDRFRAQESQFALWQMEATRVAAPPFGEAARRMACRSLPRNMFERSAGG